MSKNAEGWIRHRGGKCPVEIGAIVDIRNRDGRVFEGVRASNENCWVHLESPSLSDVMAYRLHKPAEQVEPFIEAVQAFNALAKVPQLDGPTGWRDRITEIDATTQALTIERAELVQKLASEGFALIGRINELLTDAAQKHEDMSDWRNWKVGDFIEIVSVEKAEVCASYYDDGALVKIESVEREKYKGTMPVKIIDSDGDYIWPELAGIKWHSRPSA